MKPFCTAFFSRLCCSLYLIMFTFKRSRLLSQSSSPLLSSACLFKSTLLICCSLRWVLLYALTSAATIMRSLCTCGSSSKRSTSLLDCCQLGSKRYLKILVSSSLISHYSSVSFAILFYGGTGNQRLWPYFNVRLL